MSLRPATDKGFRGSYEFLSNFYPSPIEIAGVVLPTVEHAFQAIKIDLQRDVAKLREFSNLNASEAKRIGRSGEMRPDWPKIRVPVMANLHRLKYQPGSYLAGKLLQTGNLLLEEHNYWHDAFWGIYKGAGFNWCGRTQMRVRMELGGFEEDFGIHFFLYGDRV